jgi:EAL domain-containing protein (putative c-di-GMP-specific phosphodiesterase class I)
VKLGCQLGQGWYFGKPMSAEKARELLAARGRDESDSNSIPRRNAASN